MPDNLTDEKLLELAKEAESEVAQEEKQRKDMAQYYELDERTDMAPWSRFARKPTQFLPERPGRGIRPDGPTAQRGRRRAQDSADDARQQGQAARGADRASQNAMRQELRQGPGITPGSVRDSVAASSGGFPGRGAVNPRNIGIGAGAGAVGATGYGLGQMGGDDRLEMAPPWARRAGDWMVNHPRATTLGAGAGLIGLGGAGLYSTGRAMFPNQERMTTDEARQMAQDRFPELSGRQDMDPMEEAMMPPEESMGMDPGMGPDPVEALDMATTARQTAIGLSAIAMGAGGVATEDPQVDEAMAEVFHEVADLAEVGAPDLGQPGMIAMEWVEINPRESCYGRGNRRNPTRRYAR